MFQPTSLFIALRYLRSRRRHRFTGFVSLVSLLGIALGVAALVIVLSVMNGFEREVTRHVLGMTAHALLAPANGQLHDWPALRRQALTVPGVAGVAPYVRGSGMLSRRGEVRGVVVEGIDPTLERETTDIDRYLPAAVLDRLVAGSRRVLMGKELAAELGVTVGDHLTMMVPNWDAEGRARPPRYERLEVAGLFHVGMHQYDAKLVLMALDDAAAVFHLDAAVSGLRVRFDDAATAPLGARRLAAGLEPRLGVVDWTQYHRNFFIALESQKRIMFVILVLIIAVAAFNVAANMIMVVTEKVRDIAILRTLGATRRSILGLFLLQGALIGLSGAVLGALFGAWGARESEAVARFIERTLGVDLINADVYFIDYLPADLHLVDVLEVGGAALLLAVLATLYPAWRAARVEPAQAVHYE
ncbi:MAG: lipoprotein-releasing ABC transporter permease subunit [Gammaproteobacteria bacterium]|nr:lipoprotein-releasing ABC transporter permease subunit [Gammaproteobacteria bacterium]MCP5198581.1 lipoprotein-releasing ABC transporter permease subunit [Gammaproteobacteria bacterium]